MLRPELCFNDYRLQHELYVILFHTLAVDKI